MSVLGAHSFHLPDLEAGGAEARKRKIVRRFYCATPALTAEDAQDTEEGESDPGPAQTGLARGGSASYAASTCSIRSLTGDS